MSAYRVLRRLSTGGSHLRVHAGRELATDRAVLLTQHVALPASTDRLVEHLRAARGPGIPPLLALGTNGEGLWAVSEGVEGESLRSLMTSLAKAAGFIKPNEGLAVVTRVAAVLEALHRQSLLHGDVCPSTVFLTSAGQVQLLGGGLTGCLALRDDEGPWRSEPGFLAPEQLQGPPTARSDVFHVGLMLYELAVGRPLWSGPTPSHLLQAVASFRGVPADKVKHVPEPWQGLILSALAVDPAARPTMQALTLALEEGLRHAGWNATDDELALLLARGAPKRGAEADDGALVHLTLLTATPPHGTPSVVARIATKKMTREMLAVKRPETPQPMPAIPTDERLEVRVAKLLVERGRLAPWHLQAAQEQLALTGGSLQRALASQQAVDEDTLVAAAAELTRTPSITARKLLETACPPEVLALVPRALAQATKAVPLGLKGGAQLLVAMVDPLDVDAVSQLKAAVAPKTLLTVRAGEQAVADALSRLFPGASRVSGPELSARLIDALLGTQGQRGVQAQQLIALVGALGRRLNLSPDELAAAVAAARTMAASAVSLGRLAHDVPTLDEVQERLGGGTEADACITALHAFPAQLPLSPVARAVVLAFAFSAHAGEPRPSSSRLGGALTRFKAEVPLPSALVELLFAELTRG